MVIKDKKLINFRELWELRGHLKLEVAAMFLTIPGILSMITIPVFELEKVRPKFDA